MIRVADKPSLRIQEEIRPASCIKAQRRHIAPFGRQGANGLLRIREKGVRVRENILPNRQIPVLKRRIPLLYDPLTVESGKQRLAAASSTVRGNTGKAMTIESGPSNLEWIPLAGGFDYTGDEFQTNEIAKLFQSKLGGHFYPFNFPAIVGNRSIREIIMTDKSTQKIYEKWQNLDAVILGIGVPEANTVVKLIDSNGILTQGAIGEFVANCYDKEGNYCEIENTGFKTGIPFAFLKTPAVRIGIAAEKPKWEAIRVALKSKIINVICTNQSTAEYLLSYNDAASS